MWVVALAGQARTAKNTRSLARQRIADLLGLAQIKQR